MLAWFRSFVLLIVAAAASAQGQPAAAPASCVVPPKQTEVVMPSTQRAPEKNVLGEPLGSCSQSPKTGFYRTGTCSTGPEDRGTHVVCATMTKAFLDFTVSRGNDLVTPRPDFDFPGLKPGDRWCLCATRWREALRAGVAPPVQLANTHEKALEFVTLEELRQHARGTASP